MTAQSMWVSCNQYMGVLDSLYSADAIYIYIYCNKERARQEGDPQVQGKNKQPRHPFLCTRTPRQTLWYFPERLEFNRNKTNVKKKKSMHTDSQTVSRVTASRTSE